MKMKMKKQVLSIGILITFILCTGCAKKNTEQPEPTEMVEVTEGTEETKVTEQENTEETDPLAEYQESDQPERFGADVYYEIIGELKQEPADQIYGNINPDGSIDLLLDVVDGTPYQIEGPVFDHEMFSVQDYVRNRQGDSDAVGSGSITHLYRFIPQQAGETDILMLYTYYVDEILEGYIYHVTVEEDLTCHIDWYAYMRQGENFELIQEAD